MEEEKWQVLVDQCQFSSLKTCKDIEYLCPQLVWIDRPVESKDLEIVKKHEQIPGWAYIEPSAGIYDARANGRFGQIYAWQARMAPQLTTNELGRGDKS